MTKAKSTQSPPRGDTTKQQGSVLLEALIGILIFSMGILALVGLQAASTKFATDAKYRSDAAYLANQTLGNMWVDTANISAYAVTDQTVPELPGGKRTIAVTGDTLTGYVVTVTLTWLTPGATGSTPGSPSAPHRYLSVTEIHDRCNALPCT